MATIQIICAGAARAAVSAAAQASQALAGDTLTFISGPVGRLLGQIRAGVRAPLVVLSRSGMDTLQAEHRLDAQRVAPLGTTCVGLAMAPGASLAFSDPSLLGDRLRAAPSLAYGDPAGGDSSGTHFAAVLGRLGLTAELAAKTTLAHSGVDVVRQVADGAAALGATQLSVIRAHPEVVLAGVLPPDLQKYTTYCIGVCAPLTPAEEIVAQRLWTALTDASARDIYEAMGLSQVQPDT